MKVGYLHLTQSPSLPPSGVTRYGQKLAAAVGQRDDLAVCEVTVRLPDQDVSQGAPQADMALSQQLSQAAQTLSAVAVVHVQYSQFVWHDNLLPWLRALSMPVVVTLHDMQPHLYPTGSLPRLLWLANQQQRSLSKRTVLKGGLSLRSTWRQVQRYRCDRTTLKTLTGLAARLLTCHPTEARRVEAITNSSRLQVIPHFVEPRAALPSQGAAKAALSLSDGVTVTLQGFIYRTKGHELALRALAQLPEGFHLVFAGGIVPGNEAFLAHLQRLVADLGVAHRLRITGYLSDVELERYLAASDLALCPFETLSASGSLSTWVAAGRPILAAAHSQIDDYNALAPGAIQTFSPYTPEALAAAIQSNLSRLPHGLTDVDALQHLRAALSLNSVAEQHRRCYEAAIGG